MQNIMKNKLLIILSIFLVLMTFCISSFASSKDVVSFKPYQQGTDISISVYIPSGYGTDYKEYLIGSSLGRYDNGTYGLTVAVLLSNCPFYYDGTWLSPKVDSVYYHDTYNYNYNSLAEVPKSIDLSTKSILDLDSTDSYRISVGGLDNYRFKYSTYTVFKDSSEKETVFQPAPQDQVEPMKETQVEEIPQLVVEILVLILPVILMVFGILLLVFLIKSKNFFHQ